MNSSRENQENSPEAKTTETRRAEAFDKWLCWNPGHNARERAIVAHMTPGERAEFQRFSGLAGALFGVVIAGGMAIVIPLLVFGGVFTVGRIVAITLYLPLACFVVLRVKRAVRRFLWRTAWAKAQGGEDGCGS
jgi:predicted lipid-binding transport protein (Tim44 family)